MRYSVILMLIIGALGLLVMRDYGPLAEGVPTVVAQQAPLPFPMPPPPSPCDPATGCLEPPQLPTPRLGG